LPAEAPPVNQGLLVLIIEQRFAGFDESSLVEQRLEGARIRQF
jgi:hypothetical protein